MRCRGQTIKCGGNNISRGRPPPPLATALKTWHAFAYVCMCMCPSLHADGQTICQTKHGPLSPLRHGIHGPLRYWAAAVDVLPGINLHLMFNKAALHVCMGRKRKSWKKKVKYKTQRQGCDATPTLATGSRQTFRLTYANTQLTSSWAVGVAGKKEKNNSSIT